ncbi:MAG: hypothetical protein ACM31N_04930 [Deltaproteobacteria bacterium]
MEGILFDIELFGSPIAALCGLALLVIAACGILLGNMADEESKGNPVFWAESPFTDIGESAPVEGVKYPKAA